MAQSVESLPTMWETQVRSLGQEDHLEKEMATHSSILSWRIPWTEKPGGLQSMDHKELDTTEQLSEHTHTHIYFFQILFHYRLLQDTEYNSLYYAIGLCYLAV